jgi:hypothetical protein
MDVQNILLLKSNARDDILSRGMSQSLQSVQIGLIITMATHSLIYRLCASCNASFSHVDAGCYFQLPLILYSINEVVK